MEALIDDYKNFLSLTKDEQKNIIEKMNWGDVSYFSSQVFNEKQEVIDEIIDLMISNSRFIDNNDDLPNLTREYINTIKMK